MTHITAPITKKRLAIAMTVMAVTGLSVLPAAGGVASAMEQPAAMQSQTAPAAMHGQSQAATDLRVAMNNLLREHVSVSLNVTRSITGDASQRQIDGAMEAQYANSDALAAAVGSIYGGEAQSQFSTLFREHIVESNKYAMAVEADDPVAKQAAQVELQEYLNDIAAFFSGAIPGLPAQDVYGLLNEHEELINKSTEAYKAGDYVQSYQLEREALKQISRAADALSGAIIASQPGKF